MGRLHADVFFQDRYMLNEVSVKIKLTRSKNKFCLIGSADIGYAIRIVAAELHVRKVKLSPLVFLAHAKALEQGTAKYPVKLVVCKTFTIPAGFLDLSHEKLFSGQLPARLVVGLVDVEPFNGAIARNPFNFQNYGLNEIAVYLDGQQAQSVRVLRPDYVSTSTPTCLCLPERTRSIATKATIYHVKTTHLAIHSTHTICHRISLKTIISIWFDRETYVWCSSLQRLCSVQSLPSSTLNSTAL